MIDLPEAPRGVEIVGPFVTERRFKLVVDGYELPFVDCGEGADGGWEVRIDHQVVLIPTREELERHALVLSIAMPRAAGYGWIGAKEKLPFARRCIGITGVRFEGDDPKPPTLQLVREP